MFYSALICRISQCYYLTLSQNIARFICALILYHSRFYCNILKCLSIAWMLLSRFSISSIPVFWFPQLLFNFKKINDSISNQKRLVIEDWCITIAFHWVMVRVIFLWVIFRSVLLGGPSINFGWQLVVMFWLHRSLSYLTTHIIVYDLPMNYSSIYMASAG